MKQRNREHSFGLRWVLLCCILIGTGEMFAQTTFVWPGDANENGQVNHIDLLYLGLRYGDAGPPRDSVSINWTGHEVVKWLPPVPGRPDPAHADCNGDGNVNATDITAIEANYLFDTGVILADSSSFTTSAGTAPPLTLDFAPGPLLSGATDTIFIELGDNLIPVDSLLGFAATLSFDSTLVDSAYPFFDNSWLGTPGTDLESVGRYRPGELDLAATRTDQQNAVNGQGRIGGVVIVMTENLKRAIAVDSLKLEFTTLLGLTSGLRVIPMNPMPQTAAVYSATEPLEAIVYPNPANEVLNVSIVSNFTPPLSGRLLNTVGQSVRQFNITSREFTIYRDGLLPGMYILEISGPETLLRRKIIFQN